MMHDHDHESVERHNAPFNCNNNASVFVVFVLALTACIVNKTNSTLVQLGIKWCGQRYIRWRAKVAWYLRRGAK